MGAHKWTRGHHPSALRDDIFCIKNPFVSMFYIYIAHFKMLMWQLFCSWVGPSESPQHKALSLFCRQATQGLEAKPALKCLRNRNCTISCICQIFPYCME